MKKAFRTLLLSSSLILAINVTYAHEDAPQAPQHEGVVSEASSGNTAELSLAGGKLSGAQTDVPGKSAELFRFVLP